jgi:hypothetical protein
LPLLPGPATGVVTLLLPVVWPLALATPLPLPGPAATLDVPVGTLEEPGPAEAVPDAADPDLPGEPLPDDPLPGPAVPELP